MSIEVNHVSCRYAEKTPFETEALQDVSFRIEDGEFVGVMGHTGCGKSTLIQLIAGLLTPSDGHVLLDGADIHALRYNRSVLRKTVGLVFQYPEYQLFETTVEKDVAFALKHSSLGKEQIAERVKEALELLGFSYEDIRKKAPLSLSGGEKRRVAIAGVLAARPKLLLFDEPLAGLDPCGCQAFLELASSLNRKGVTIVMVSHSTDSLCEYAGRILVLHKGRLVADGTPDEVFRAHDSTAVPVGPGNVRRVAQRLYEKGVLASPAVTKRKALVEEIRASLKAGDGL